MILQRLYQLAVRENLLGDTAFEELRIPCAIQVGKDGAYLGMTEQRGTIETPARKRGGSPTVRPDQGLLRSIPRAHGNTANRGFARYFADTLPRVLPLLVEAEDQAKADASRVTFWAQIDRAAEATNDPALRDVQAFGRRLEEFTERIRADYVARGFSTTDRCTFLWDPDQGTALVEREPVRAWYRQFFQSVQKTRQEDGPRGVCQITGTVGSIPRIHEPKLQRIPGGLSTGVSIASYDKPAFASYGLEGTANAGLGYEATEGYLRALQALIDKNLENRSGRFSSGGVLFLFWTQQPVDAMEFDLDTPTPEQVERILGAAHAGDDKRSEVQENQFYLLALSANAARAIVRDYLELPLLRVQENLRRWFRDLTIADAGKDHRGQPSCRFPLSRLALATAFDFDGVGPETPAALLRAAFSAGPVPESLLAACTRRLRAEGSAGCFATRMALIKLILLRRNVTVSVSLAEDDRRPPYVYGRLLRIFEQIQYAALGDVNANVVDKFYGTFSAAPGLVFCRLYNNARNHLRKIRGDKPGDAVALDKLLTRVSNLLPADQPQGLFSLRDQGLFALGYYHQKAADFARTAEIKAQRAANETSETESESEIPSV